jgi:hypothetical protein
VSYGRDPHENEVDTMLAGGRSGHLRDKKRELRCGFLEEMKEKRRM